MIFMSSVFAADNFSNLSQSFNQGYKTGYATGGGQWSGVASGLNEINQQYQQQQQAQAYDQSVAQYQQQTYQQQQNQGNTQGWEKIFSIVAFSDIGSAQNAYDEFTTGRQNFNGTMFTLNIVKNEAYYSVFNSLQVGQFTTVYQGTDGKYYITRRIQ